MIELYCDGSCPKPNGPGGWAFIVVGNNNRHEGAGGERSTTNNRMELMAAIKGFEWLDSQRYGGNRVKLVCDSQYVVNGLSQWGFKWRQKNWRHLNRDGEWVKVKNEDLWKRAFHLAHDVFSGEFEWVRGHNGHELNERCDKLAGEQAWSIIGQS